MLRVSAIRSEIQAFADIFEAAVDPLSMANQNADEVEMFICLGRVLHQMSKADVNRVGLGATKALHKSV